MTDKTFGSYKQVNPFIGKKRTLSTKIQSPGAEEKSTWQIPKSQDPGPGSYKVDEALRKTYAHVHGSLKNKNVPLCIFDEMAKRKKFVPGAGKYETDDKVKKKIHKDP
jgi:hypothetical protein